MSKRTHCLAAWRFVRVSVAVVVTQLLLFFGQTSAHRSSGTSNVLLLAILSTVLLMVLQSAVSNLKHIFNGHWHEDKFG